MTAEYRIFKISIKKAIYAIRCNFQVETSH